MSDSDSSTDIHRVPYRDRDHRIDAAVAEHLDEFGMKEWRQGASIADLIFVLQSVVECDSTLDHKCRGLRHARQLLKDNHLLPSQLAHAWQTGSYRDVRELGILHAPYKRYIEPEPLSRTQLNALKKALTSTYQGHAVDAFYTYLKQNNEAFHKTSGQRYYGKFCSIVQSSGTGKTRLLLEANFYRRV
ncbi:hypothetical protein OG21DRAFT_1485811 [Imleria badia]|nr:hypothetical protein OG21DRAFT_1485811 [Imleria badia]